MNFSLCANMLGFCSDSHICYTSYTVHKLVLHHNGSSVNYAVYLHYGSMGTSELQENVINKILV